MSGRFEDHYPDCGGGGEDRGARGKLVQVGGLGDFKVIVSGDEKSVWVYLGDVYVGAGALDGGLYVYDWHVTDDASDEMMGPDVWQELNAAIRQLHEERGQGAVQKYIDEGLRENDYLRGDGDVRSRNYVVGYITTSLKHGEGRMWTEQEKAEIVWAANELIGIR